MVKLYKIKFLKDTELCKVGDVKNATKKNAESYIKEGYAEYVEEPKPKKRKIKENQVRENLDKLLKGELQVDPNKEEINLPKPKKRKTKEKQEPKEEKIKEALKQEKQQQELESYKENEITWLDDDFYDNWDKKIKGHLKKLLGHHEDFDEDDENKLLFLAHSLDTIRGQPQLVEKVQKKIPLVKLAIKKVTEKIGKKKIEKEIKKIFFLDERLNTNQEGYLKKCYAKDFWLYRIISEEGKEYYIFTKEKLPNCTCNFTGMLVELDDFAEFSRSMKIKSLSRLFFMKSFEPDIKILTKEQLVEFTSKRNINAISWLDFLAYHKEFKSYNRFIEDVELLRSAFVLAGKLHGYPLHLAFLGTSGTKKTNGLIETTGHKFAEEPIIFEGADSRIKGLSPSFKEKPANIGYLAKQERIGFIDEIGKMVELETIKAHNPMTNCLGELNFLLEHKKRCVGSGNDNDIEVQATAKFLFATNPISNKDTIYQHIGLIDPTTMSRMLWWVQDDEEIKYLIGEDSIEKFPRLLRQGIGIDISNKKIEKKNISLFLCSGNMCVVEYIYMSREEFLTLFDSCYRFLCDIEDNEVKKLIAITTQLAKEPMKSSVWKPRAYHHVKLLIDGLCKHRCLFEDYNFEFIANQMDYDRAERILIRMVKGWDTTLTPKEEFNP